MILIAPQVLTGKRVTCRTHTISPKLRLRY